MRSDEGLGLQTWRSGAQIAPADMVCLVPPSPWPLWELAARLDASQPEDTCQEGDRHMEPRVCLPLGSRGR